MPPRVEAGGYTVPDQGKSDSTINMMGRGAEHHVCDARSTRVIHEAWQEFRQEDMHTPTSKEMRESTGRRGLAPGATFSRAATVAEQEAIAKHPAQACTEVHRQSTTGKG